jgi:hypothetical protein
MFISTSHGTLAYEEHGKGDAVVLFIHGNSSCRKVFKRQMTSEFYEQYRMITFDLPGHGESENSPHPHQHLWGGTVVRVPGVGHAPFGRMRKLAMPCSGGFLLTQRADPQLLLGCDRHPCPVGRQAGANRERARGGGRLL